MSEKRNKRPYTMTPAALEQRRNNQAAAAEAATGPRTNEGKAASSRNGWKHGRHSAINRAQFGLGAAHISKLFGKPCVTTCPFHPDNPERNESPCSLVLDGLTHAGGSCLDKTVYVHALDALMSAINDGESEGMNGLLATEMAANVQVLHGIREAIAEHGIMVAIPVVTKNGIEIDPDTGKPYVSDYKANPVLAHLIKFSESMGINFAELMATPKARERQKDDDDAAGALQQIFGRMFQAAGKRLQSPQDSSDG